MESQNMHAGIAKCINLSEVCSIDADRSTEGVANGPVEHEVCDCVETGRLAVNDDQGGAVALGQFGKTSRRVDDERGAGHDEQIGGARLEFRAAHWSRPA